MRKKDILELKKRFKKDYCTFTKMTGCYVSGEKHILLKFRETFLNLGEDEYFKYLEIAKKVLSGTLGNNILELNFPLNEELVNEKQISLLNLKNSRLKDDALLDEFYDSIIDSYDHVGNYIILLFHDSYDVMTKTSDNRKLDESEEVYEYIMCAICPVELSEPGLRYFEKENEIASRVRDWVVSMPAHGFVYPAFIDRSTDVNSIMYYTKNAKEPGNSLMEGALGCYSKQTATLQKEAFKSIVLDSLEGEDEKRADKIFMDIQDNLNTMIDDYNAIYDDIDDAEEFTLNKDTVSNLLMESGISELVTSKIEKKFEDSFGEDIPLAQNLIDSKTLKECAQKKKEENLEKQLEVLQNKLEIVTKEVAADEDNSDGNDTINVEEPLAENDSTEYDVILKVKPDKVPQIKSQVIDGQKCIVIPINENELAKVNDLEELL